MAAERGKTADEIRQMTPDDFYDSIIMSEHFEKRRTQEHKNLTKAAGVKIG